MFGFRARLVRISSQRGVGEYISCPEIRTDHTFHSLKVRYCEDLGVTANQASTLYTFFGVASALVRVLAGRFFDISRTNPLYALQLAMAVSGISTLLMPLAPSYDWLVLYAIMYGLADGGMGCATFVIPAKLLSEEERAMGMAIFQTVTYTSCAGGSPLAGKVRARYPGSTSVNNRPRGWGWGVGVGVVVRRKPRMAQGRGSPNFLQMIRLGILRMTSVSTGSKAHSRDCTSS